MVLFNFKKQLFDNGDHPLQNQPPLIPERGGNVTLLSYFSSVHLLERQRCTSILPLNGARIGFDVCKHV
jgi:hypothetical protein